MMIGMSRKIFQIESFDGIDRAESYLDTGNRGAFANAAVPVQMHPDFALGIGQAEACAPLVTDGPRLHGARRALLERLPLLGFVFSDDLDVRFFTDDGAAVVEVSGVGVVELRFAMIGQRYTLAAEISCAHSR